MSWTTKLACGVVASGLAYAVNVLPVNAQGTTSIENVDTDPAAARFATRAERLAATPLDWNVTRGAAGQSLVSQVGWLGRSWNWSTRQVHHAVGYPANIGGAATKELCVSESFSPSSACGGATVLNTGCSMTFATNKSCEYNSHQF
jgi:hypothetical protein